jgi:hypothetical protein
MNKTTFKLTRKFSKDLVPFAEVSGQIYFEKLNDNQIGEMVVLRDLLTSVIEWNDIPKTETE